MNAKFEVKMTQKILYDFWMNHTYRSFSGWFSIIFGVAVIILALVTRDTVQPYMTVIYVVFGLYFLAFQPISLYLRAAKQVKVNPMFKETLTYEVNDKGITTTQKDQKAEITWEQILKVAETGQSYLLYTGKRNSFVLPKESMGDKITVVEGLIKKHMKPEQVKIK
ncbi:MAG: YcxB family protein [Eubacteriales bacterium]|nr:YcxB family protein [Eubacteriales bacterium]